MKTPEDEAFDDLARRQGAWGGGFPAKKAMAADKLQGPVCDKDPHGCWNVRCQLGKQCKNLAQPEQEFFTHNVERPYDWSEWVCPDPKGYLLKCCDCGLVHDVEFGVVRYKSETEREDCEPVEDPNLQAVFRMRRSEQWSPADTAHRSGGLPMEQPAQEPVALPCCGYADASAVKWNQYNQVVQCHNCGQVYHPNRSQP